MSSSVYIVQKKALKALFSHVEEVRKLHSLDSKQNRKIFSFKFLNFIYTFISLTVCTLYVESEKTTSRDGM